MTALRGYQRKAVVVVAAILSASLVVIAYVRIRQFVDHGRADNTAERMLTIARMCKEKQPRITDRQHLCALLKEWRPCSYLYDGWGNEIRVSVSADDRGTRHYLIRSTGSDGKLGQCCKRFVEPRFDWKADAVLLDGEWLQYW